MEKKMTKRAQSLIDVVKKIETWCNENINGEDIKVFNLYAWSGVYGWYAWMYSTTMKKVFLARGDHSRWGAYDDDMVTGMTEERFQYYMFTHNYPVNKDYTITNLDGNLVFEDNFIPLMAKWDGIKKRLIQLDGETENFSNFKA